MLSGSTADRLGRRRVFRWGGLLLFVLGSLLCSLAPGLGWLVAARALQAVGGSMLNPPSRCRSSPTPSPNPGNGPARSACGAGSSASAWRPAPCSAGCWSTSAAGRRSSG
ncbi:MFS transporter [Streptomyces sp. GKU 257-1]|nr:MFS transporter [Streptomyces sp. GKU 257-1]